MQDIAKALVAGLVGFGLGCAIINATSGALTESPLPSEYVDATTLGKPGQLGFSSRLSPGLSALAGDQCARRAVAAAALTHKSECSALAMSARIGLRSPTMRSQALPNRVVKASASAERSYVMVKPDGVQRGLVGEIISRFERKGFYLKGLKLFSCPEELAKEHYGDLSSKPFFQDLVDYITSGPVVCMVWEGKGVVKSARKLIGATNPLESEPGTIRGDFAVEVGRNVIHGSDSIENGEREVGLWFGSGDGLAEWTPTMEPWLREVEC